MIEQGNSLYRSLNYEGAIQVYISAIESAPKELFTKHFISDYSKLKLAIITNLANCFLKSKNFEATVLQCEEGLKIFPENVKIRYIQGTALSEIQEYDKALTVLREAKTLEPSNREVLEKINLVIQAKKEYNSKMKEMFGGKLQPIIKKEPEIIQKSEPVPVKNTNWGFYALGAASLLGIAGLLYKKYR